MEIRQSVNTNLILNSFISFPLQISLVTAKFCYLLPFFSHSLGDRSVVEAQALRIGLLWLKVTWYKIRHIEMQKKVPDTRIKHK